MCLIITIFSINLSLNTSFKWLIENNVRSSNYKNVINGTFTDYEQSLISFGQRKKSISNGSLNKYLAIYEKI